MIHPWIEASASVVSEDDRQSEEEDAPVNCRNGCAGSADDVEEEDDDNFSFLGYVHPTPMESRHGHSSRTELYRCQSCMSYTRFPRYNRAALVTDTKRGRCGEYSMLLYSMLRAMGYDGARWVVDWADHGLVGRWEDR
jgi:hypothetical protein